MEMRHVAHAGERHLADETTLGVPGTNPQIDERRSPSKHATPVAAGAGPARLHDPDSTFSGPTQDLNRRTKDEEIVDTTHPPRDARRDARHRLGDARGPGSGLFNAGVKGGGIIAHAGFPLAVDEPEVRDGDGTSRATT